MPDTPVISAEQMRQLEQEGYLLVKGLLDPVKNLEPVVAEYGEALDQLARELFGDGVLSSTYSDLPFGERFIAGSGTPIDPRCRAGGLRLEDSLVRRHLSN